MRQSVVIISSTFNLCEKQQISSKSLIMQTEQPGIKALTAALK